MSLGTPDAEFEELLQAYKSTPQMSGHGLFTELQTNGEPIQMEQESTGAASMAAVGVIQGAAIDNNQAEWQNSKPVEKRPDASIPALLIHATSDIESEGDEIRRASSAVTVIGVSIPFFVRRKNIRNTK